MKGTGVIESSLRGYMDGRESPWLKLKGQVWQVLVSRLKEEVVDNRT